MGEVCKVCGLTLDIHDSAMCFSCHYLVHPDCIIRESCVCQECWFTGMSCKISNCFAYHCGVCLAERCHGVIDSRQLSHVLHLERDVYTLSERSLLYRQVHRHFTCYDSDIRKALQSSANVCSHTECLAHEKSLCLASMCFGIIVMPKVAPVVLRASIYDDFVLRDIAEKVPGSNHYIMKCSLCGDSIPCSGDAARHFLALKKPPKCSNCRRL